MVRMTLAATAFAALISSSALAADHLDSPAANAEPSADIADVYAWMTEDASALNLAVTVVPFAGADTAFSDAVTYAFHVNSSTGYGEAQTETLVVCQFYDVDAIECWAGDSYVTGDPSDPAGITDENETIRVFAGLRDDPFYFELAGFQATVETVNSVAGDLTFDDAGCPQLDAETANSLVAQLQSGPDGADASDTLAGANVMAIVLQIDTEVVTAGGPLLSVWASTHRAE